MILIEISWNITPLLYWTMQKHILEAKSVPLQAQEKEGGRQTARVRRQNKAPTETQPQA